ncbi:putative ribonuclease H protein [Vitis vinifera]|uniref:Putative ribonuclease H protein n=1 Tax=Vitis vinifera TaxID=29760 RepID=A0A438BWR8_VITVI|nr:putative ribonuclease H protein [Vitis vinifera]
MCIQETKIQEMSEGIVRSLSTGRFLDWRALNAEGAAGGILICWDKRVLDILEWEEGHFTLSCRFKIMENGATWVFTGVYGPFTKMEREGMWEELGALRGLWDDPWCLGGDFNITLSQQERSSHRRITSAMRRFAETVDELELVDMPLQGENSPGMGGSTIRGSASYRLATKMKEIKKRLKVWNKEVFGRLETNKATALEQVVFWDQVESDRILTVEEAELKKAAKESFKKWVLLEEAHWRQHSREIWLREGDRNTGFFHRMASAHRRNNAMGSIKVNGEWLVEEQEVKEGIVNSFQQLLTEDMAWQADIGNIQVGCISQQDAECIEVPFVENEIHSALMEMNGDKAPGPDGFSVAFWQNAWAFAKEEIMEMFKEFHEHSTFVRSLNNTFLVVSSAQNAFVMGRQILDASLIANEVLQKMGFGNKWVGWMWSCVSSAKFSILVNGVSAGFFPSSRGLRQGDPLSPYLFVMGMEILDVLIRRAVEGGYLSGCNIRDGSSTSVHISHLFFADDTIVFCEANKDQVSHLSWILFWFEAASGLRMNLAKSEIIPVGEVEEIQELAAELGCRVGSLPAHYLGLPLGVPNRASSMWDGVEERVRQRLALWKRQYISKGGRITLIKSALASMPIYQMSIFRMPKSVARRVEKIQRDFLWGGGNLGGKIHLVKWDVVCTEKRNGGLGLRRIATLNRALLGKWIWRFACERDNLWKQVISTKYGQEDYGWRAKKVSGAAGVGVWKEIMKESDWCWENLDASIEEMWDHHSGQGDWNLIFERDFNDWELDMVGDLLRTLRGHRPSMEDDSIKWRQGRNVSFRVKEAYRLLDKSNASLFPARGIWVDRVPTKVSFFAWEATWGKVLTLDKLQIRGVQLPNCCFLCGCAEENVNHILLHCIVARALWDIIFGLLDIKWVFPETVKEALTSWRALCWEEKETDMEIHSVVIFGRFGRREIGERLSPYRLFGVDSFH